MAGAAVAAGVERYVLNHSIGNTFGSRAIVAGNASGRADVGVVESGFPREEGRISVAVGAVLAIDWNMRRGLRHQFASRDGLGPVVASHTSWAHRRMLGCGKRLGW